MPPGAIHNTGAQWCLLQPHGTCPNPCLSYDTSVMHIGSCLEADALVSADLYRPCSPTRMMVTLMKKKKKKKKKKDSHGTG